MADPKTMPTDPAVILTPGVRKIPRFTRPLGQSMFLRSDGDNFRVFTRPSNTQLAAWEAAVRQEPTLQAGVTMITRSVVARIGQFVHPVPQVADFVNANIEGRIKNWIELSVRNAVIFGFSAREILWKYRREGNQYRTWIEDLVPFHPLHVQFILNDWGRLTHGERVKLTPQRTGVWVPFPSHTAPRGERYGSFVRLPKSKLFHTHINSSHPCGQSMIESVVKFHLFKNVFIDMYSTALDRYGRPLVAVKVPPQNTQELVQDPGAEEPRFKTLQEQVAEELENIGPDSFLVLTQTDKVNQPIEFQSLTTANNYGDAFKMAIEFCDQNMLMGLGVPNLLLLDQGNSLGSSGASERQIEIFNSLIDSLFDQVLTDFTEQAVRQLITFNFDQTQPQYQELGHIERLPARPADVNTMSTVIQNMASIGVVNTDSPEHRNWARSVLGIPQIADERIKKPRSPAPSQPASASSETE